jgi:thiamine biosynthesis protein ThiS
MPLSLSDEEIQRYRRQLSMPEIGTRGQQHLKQATILIAGLGGLGSISAYYMAAAGVGQLKIADSDQVASHNLNRQILHTTVDIGKFKTVSACEKLKALNPWCHIDPLAERISDDTVGVMVSGCDLILDGTDNIGTRRVLNRAAQEAGIPFIFITGHVREQRMEKDLTIEITLNDVPERVRADSSLDTLIHHFREADPDLIVELNGRFVYPRTYASTVVRKGDRLEFINPNFGG